MSDICFQQVDGFVRNLALQHRLRPDPPRAGLFLVDNHLIFQVPLGFEEISALFSETSWLSMLMQKRGPLFSITSWLRSELFGPRPRRRSSVHDPRIARQFFTACGVARAATARQGAIGGRQSPGALWRFAKHKKSSCIGVRLELNIAFGVVVKLNRLAN